MTSGADWMPVHHSPFTRLQVVSHFPNRHISALLHMTARAHQFACSTDNKRACACQNRWRCVTVSTQCCLLLAWPSTPRHVSFHNQGKGKSGRKEASSYSLAFTASSSSSLLLLPLLLPLLLLLPLWNKSDPNAISDVFFISPSLVSLCCVAPLPLCHLPVVWTFAIGYFFPAPSSVYRTEMTFEVSMLAFIKGDLSPHAPREYDRLLFFWCALVYSICET